MVRKLAVFVGGGMMCPASRIRGYYMAKYLSKNGFETEVFFSEIVKGNIIKKVLYLIRDFINKINAITKSDEEIIVYIQRGVCLLPQFSLIFLLLSKFILRKKVIYDIDDALFLIKPFAINNLIKFSDLVIVGSHELLNNVKKHNKNVFLIPTSADLSRYIPDGIIHKDNGISLGFVASPSTNKYMKLLIKPLEALAKSYDFELRVISAPSHADYRPFNLLYESFERKGVNVKLILWSLNDEFYQLQNIDIGLAPLFDEEWEKYKGGFKIINYMAAGIPPIASNVGEHSYIIQDGVNGFLCDNNQEWINNLRKLIEDEKLRKNMGANARKTIEEKYSMEKNAKILAKILAKFLSDNVPH